MKITLSLVGLLATGIFTAPSVSMAHGMSGGPMFASNGNNHHFDHDHHRYGNYYGLSYPAYGLNYYDANYFYTATPEQVAAAQQQVDYYFTAVKKHHKRPAKRRYISVETLRPTDKQLKEYSKNQSAGKLADQSGDDPSKFRCLMVYDTQTKQFVGSGCYLVTGEPPIGDVATFQTVSAEFVGRNSL